MVNKTLKESAQAAVEWLDTLSDEELMNKLESSGSVIHYAINGANEVEHQKPDFSAHIGGKRTQA